MGQILRSTERNLILFKQETDRQAAAGLEPGAVTRHCQEYHQPVADHPRPRHAGPAGPVQQLLTEHIGLFRNTLSSVISRWKMFRFIHNFQSIFVTK